MPPVPDTLTDTNRSVVEALLDAHGYDSLTPTQSKALSNKTLNTDQNTLLTAPTGEGKTMVAESVVKKTTDQGKAVAYLVPSYQLTQSKQDEFEEWYSGAIAGRAGQIGEVGITVLTFESFFQAVARDLGDLSAVDVVVFDDFHEIYSSFRGPRIEQAIATCLDMDMNIFAMSATVGNPEEIADWLDAHLIESGENRGTPLEEVPVEKGSGTVAGQIAELVTDNLDKAPFLVFNNTRQWAESRAQTIADTGAFESADVDFESKIDSALPTEMTTKYEELADAMNNGVAFHHSGLDKSVRDLIVEAIKDGEITCICATPGLAYGFDAPIKSVIVAGFRRGRDWIGRYEYIQWIGRAGRAGYDLDEAYAFPLWNSKEAHSRFQFGTPPTEKDIEPITSHIDSTEEQRRLLLELVYFGWEDIDEIQSFVGETLYHKQMTDDGLLGRDTVQREIKQELDWLVNKGFIDEDGYKYVTTDLGEGAIEFNFSSWVDTTLEQIHEFYKELPLVDSDPLDLLIKIIESFDRLTLRNTPETPEIADHLDDGHPLTDETSTAVVLYHYWGAGESLDTLEDELGIGLSDMSNVAKRVSKIVSGVEELSQVHPDCRVKDWFETLETQVEYGVPPADIAFVEAIQGLGRKRVNTLKDGLADALAYEDDINPGDGTLAEVLEMYVNSVGEDQATAMIRTHTDQVGDVIAERIVTAVTGDAQTTMTSDNAPPRPVTADGRTTTTTTDSDDTPEEDSPPSRSTTLDDF